FCTHRVTRRTRSSITAGSIPACICCRNRTAAPNSRGRCAPCSMHAKAGTSDAMTGRVLILDDDAAVGETIGFAAEAIGMDVKSVTKPADFFRAADEWKPTHIILDLVMPEMDGVEIMRHLAARRCRARIIILS